MSEQYRISPNLRYSQKEIANEIIEDNDNTKAILLKLTHTLFKERKKHNSKSKSPKLEEWQMLGRVINLLGDYCVAKIF